MGIGVLLMLGCSRFYGVDDMPSGFYPKTRRTQHREARVNDRFKGRTAVFLKPESSILNPASKRQNREYTRVIW
jgi:hypothetical protein